jgi:cytochrome c oxidase assembly factor CtaG
MSGFLSMAMLPVVTPVAMGLAAGTATGVVLASSALGALYARGYRRLRRLGRIAVIRPFHAVAFAGATGALALAFSAPLAALAPQVFSVHVLQHLLLFCVAAPLFVRSRVVLALLWALSSRTRHAIVAGWKALGLASAAGAVARPASSWLVFVVSFVLSQLAALFGWFAADSVAHAAAHLWYLLAGCAFWWTIFAPPGQRRTPYATAALYVAVTAVIAFLMGGMIILFPHAFERDPASLIWGLTRVRDRQLAGALLWLGIGLASLGALRFLALRLMPRSGR